MKTMIRNLTTAIGLVAVGCATAWAEPGKSNDPLQALHARIRDKREPAMLFVGNSYSFGVPKAFRKLAGQRGRRVKVEQVTTGGWTLARHAENDATLQKIREGGWDVVVFQEQSRIPSLPGPQRNAAMARPLRKLVEAAREAGAVPVLYQTWGYREGDARRGGDDFHAMTRRLREGYREAAAKAGNVAVIPVGDAWEREVAAGRANKLFMPDGSHPTNGGNALTARVFFEAIFPKKG
jgi:hypothetical protein